MQTMPQDARQIVADANYTLAADTLYAARMQKQNGASPAVIRSFVLCAREYARGARRFLSIGSF